MELRHMRYFVAVAEEMHFGRAAEALRIAQPALSQQVKALERELGVALIDRSRRRIALTLAGRLFLDEARATLAQAERAVRTARRADRGEVGRLSLGFVGSANHEVLPRLLGAFRNEYPDVELELETMSTLEQAEAFGEGRIQVGLLRPPVDRDLELVVVAREPLVAVLPEGHPLADAERVPLAALSGEDFMLWPRRSGAPIHDQIVGFCRDAGFSPNVVQETTGMQTMAGLVAAGLGVSLVIAVPEHLQSRGVVYREVDEPRATFDLVAAWDRGGGSPVVDAFVGVVERLAAGTAPAAEQRGRTRG